MEQCEVSLSWGKVADRETTAAAQGAFLSLYAKGYSTFIYYNGYLRKSFPPLGLDSTTAQIQKFVDHDCGKEGITPGGRAAYFRAIRAFFNWAYSPASGLGLEPGENPITWVKPPKVSKRLMPAQNLESFKVLMTFVDNLRDMAILFMLMDSGGRLSEVANIRRDDILWDEHKVKVIAKGGEEVFMPLSRNSAILLRAWLAEFDPADGPVWGMSNKGVVTMLRRLEEASGIECNAHTFRRGFASRLRIEKVDTMDIMKLGHWKSPAMVQRYTESVTFEDSRKSYVAPTEGLSEQMREYIHSPRAGPCRSASQRPPAYLSQPP